MKEKAERLLSLDVFRGLTIAAMILVNSPGNETAYPMLEHASWHGMTPTDLVFPFFLFIVGVSLVFSLKKKLEMGESRQALLLQVTKRTLILIGLGLFLNGFPHYNLEIIRLPGVLQRIAICYFMAAIFYLWTNISIQIAATTIMLALYWWIMTHLQAPGFPIGDLTKEGNFAAYIDRAVFGSHLYKPIYDPEGLLSTLPSIASTLLGNLAGYWLVSSGAPERKVTGCLQGGFVFLMAGWKWGQYFPVNKALWTSSYVLQTTGWALIVFGVIYGLIEIKGRDRWSKPFEALGKNAIAAYVLHIFFLKLQNLWHIWRPDGSPGNLRLFISDHLFRPFMSLEGASLAYASCYTLFWIVVFWNLYRRKVFIRI